MLELLTGLLELLGVWPGGRVTVEDRYAMKRKIRELRKQEQEKRERLAAKSDNSGRRV